MFFFAHISFRIFGHTVTDFSEVRLAQQKHQCARLADTPANARRDLVVDDGLVVREPQGIQLARPFQLPPQRFCVDADAHRA